MEPLRLARESGNPVLRQRSAVDLRLINRLATGG
jgi:hypothetical protein